MTITVDESDLTPSLVSLREVTKTYPGNPPLTVLSNVTLDISPGEDIAVVGPSGSGKTTMLSIMGILDQPTSGDVLIDGVNPASLTEAQRAQLRAEGIGFVFQQFFLLPTLTAWENVAEGMLYQGFKRSVRKRLAMEALDRVGLTPRATHRPGQLSGGEQQRVAIARAIAGGPRLLFADEPTGALDQTSGHMVVDHLQSIAGDGTTVVVITHDQSLAARFSRQISLLDGIIVEDISSGQARPITPLPEPSTPLELHTEEPDIMVSEVEVSEVEQSEVQETEVQESEVQESEVQETDVQEHVEETDVEEDVEAPELNIPDPRERVRQRIARARARTETKGAS